MAVIQVSALDGETGIEVSGSRLRGGTPKDAIDHAGLLKAQYRLPRYTKGTGGLRSDMPAITPPHAAKQAIT